MKIKSLSHAGLTVKNFDKAVKWWWDIFKFPLISESSLSAETLAEMKKLYNLKDGISVRFGFLRIPKGGVLEIFEFSENEQPNHCWNRPGPTHVTLDASDVKGWYAKLAARTDIEILCEPTLKDGAWWFFFRDPDGNLIELIDLGFNYFAVRVLGGIAGFFMRKGKFKKYYR